MAEAAVFRTVYPREYIRAFLREGVRPDGRPATRVRKTTVLAGPAVVANAHGAALVRLGSTAVMCAISAVIAEPPLAAPRDGYLGKDPLSMRQRVLACVDLKSSAFHAVCAVANVDLLPMASPRYRPGPPSDEAQSLSQRLTNALQTSVP